MASSLPRVEGCGEREDPGEALCPDRGLEPEVLGETETLGSGGLSAWAISTQSVKECSEVRTGFRLFSLSWIKDDEDERVRPNYTAL